MSEFQFKKMIEEYVIISRFGQMEGEQFEVRLRTSGEWIAFLNFRHPAANEIPNHRNSQGIPELFAPPEQVAGVIDMLRNEKPVWFTLYDDPLQGWLSTGVEEIGEHERDA
jgi:hypothetical protein